MPHLFDKGAEFLIRRLKSSAGLDGRYIQDGKECECRGVPGGIESAGDVVEEVPMLDTDRDWLFDPGDLVIEGKQLTPKKGDRWICQIGGQLQLFIVTPPQQGERPYRRSDQHHHMLRVFMKYRGPYGR